MTRSGKPTPNQRRDEKRAEALRENLKRRKAVRQKTGEATEKKDNDQDIG
jgi:hypothetical protein